MSGVTKEDGELKTENVGRWKFGVCEDWSYIFSSPFFIKIDINIFSVLFLFSISSSQLAEDLDVLSRSIPAIYAVIETTSNVKATHIETDLGLIIMDGTDTPFPSVPQLRTTIHRYVKTLKLDKANNKFRRNDLSLKSELWSWVWIQESMSYEAKFEKKEN